MKEQGIEAIILALENATTVEESVEAFRALGECATRDDLPRLMALLEHDDFYVREAAAWAICDLAGASALPQLLKALQKGFDQGHDCDGFQAALFEVVGADVEGVRAVLLELACSKDPALRRNAAWLLEHCDQAGDEGSLGTTVDG